MHVYICVDKHRPWCRQPLLVDNFLVRNTKMKHVCMYIYIYIYIYIYSFFVGANTLHQIRQDTCQMQNACVVFTNLYMCIYIYIYVLYFCVAMFILYLL